MANIRDVRVQAAPEAPEAPPTVEVEVIEDDFEDESSFDDEDFWESLDLLETSAKILGNVLATCRVPDRLRRLLENHIVDVGIHVDKFLVP